MWLPNTKMLALTCSQSVQAKPEPWHGSIIAWKDIEGLKPPLSCLSAAQRSDTVNTTQIILKNAAGMCTAFSLKCLMKHCSVVQLAERADSHPASESFDSHLELVYNFSSIYILMRTEHLIKIIKEIFLFLFLGIWFLFTVLMSWSSLRSDADKFMEY